MVNFTEVFSFMTTVITRIAEIITENFVFRFCLIIAVYKRFICPIIDRMKNK